MSEHNYLSLYQQDFVKMLSASEDMLSIAPLSDSEIDAVSTYVAESASR